MQHTDKAVAEFEAWYVDRFPMAERMIQAGSWVWITHRDEMRECWVASRAELVIDLPERFDKHDSGDWTYWADGVDAAIEAAGVTVKE